MTSPLPNRPWERVGADICEIHKQHYLVAVDYFSRYIELAHLPDLSGETTRSGFKNMFVRWGCPNIVITVFRPSLPTVRKRLPTTSPHYPQANGEAKRAVQTAKKILKQPDPFAALMSYRTTPIQATGVSPAQLMMGRQIRTTIPTLESHLQPSWPDLQQVRQADAKAKQRYKHNFNRRFNV